MRLLFTVLTVLLLAVALGWVLQQSPGEVIFTYRGWVIQTSLVVFAIAFSAVFFLAYVLLRVLDRLLRIPSGMRRWSEHRRSARLSAAASEAEQLSLHAGLLRRAGTEQDREALQNAWRNTPQKLKKKSFLIGAYVSERMRFGDAGDCVTVLRRALRRQWDPELVRLFGQVEGRNLKQQLQFARGCLGRHPDDPHLLLTLGRLCKKNQLWGKARSYLEQSLQLLPDPITCRELATLLEQQGEHEAAAARYKQGLNLVTSGRVAGETETAPATAAGNPQLAYTAGQAD